MTTLLDAPQSDTWFVPSQLSDEQNEQISEALEAFFGTVEEKREFPFELSALIRSVIGTSRTVFALNPGDGSVLSAFDAAYCFGIEPDDARSRRRKGSYQNLSGDFDRVSKLMEPLGQQLADTIVVFRDSKDVERTMEFLNANLEAECFVAYVVPAGVAVAVAELPGTYAGIELEELTVYFATDPDYLRDEEQNRPDIIVRKSTLDTLDLLGPWITEQRDAHSYRKVYRYGNTANLQPLSKAWKAIHREFGRRFIREDATYDLSLIGGKLINYDPSDWAKLAIAHSSNIDLNVRLHNKEITFFTQNIGLWGELLIMEDEGVLLIDPEMIEALKPIIETAERATCPLKPPKPQERLAYLSKQSKVKCIVSDEDNGFVAGKWYSVRLREEDYHKHFTKTDNVKGVLQLVQKRRRYVHQRIIIAGNVSFYDDDPNNVRYLLRHFAVPEQADIRTRYPELVAAEDARIEALQQEYLAPRGFRLKDYQAKDIAAVSVNNRAILAHQQGLGKTIEGIMFSLNAQKKAGKDVPVLIVCPQDLIPQWQREAQEKYGLKLKWIGRHKGNKGGKPVTTILPNGQEVNISGGAVKNIIEARQIARELKQGGTGWFITHFEALTSGGAKNLRSVEDAYVVRIEQEHEWVPPGRRTDPDTGEMRYFPGETITKDVEITSAQECPKCGSSMNGGYICRSKKRLHPNDRKARTCGWTRFTYRLPSVGTILATAFRQGVIVVDEGTQIASARNSNENDSSQKTKAVCGMRAAHRLVMSGTPVKNFIAQAFWLLWWGIGNKSERFDYAYSGGKAAFAKEYTVIEHTLNEESGNWHKMKEVGEVTNHTKLWSQLASVLLRRTKGETGELIVKKKDHVCYVPMGYHQREQMEFWLQNFPSLFAEKYPDDPKVKRGSHTHMAPMLGLDVKLNYASVLPQSDPDFAWTSVPVSNYTPAAYKALETIMALAKQGRQVLFGTDVKKATPWIASRLAEKGVVARTMLATNGSGDTLLPADRAAVVEEFQNGAMAVLCSTQKAIRLGHNLDKGSAVVLLGLDWDYETYAQFTERVHRLTSANPVDVYIIIPGQENLSLVGRKWEVITDKAKGAGMAIDGYLPEQNEEPPDIAAIVKEMVEKGIPATGNEIMESKVKEAWEKVPQLDQFVIPDGFVAAQATKWIIDWEKANEALDQHLQVKAEYEAEEAEIAAAEAEAMTDFLKTVVDTAVCDSLEAFFAGATAPLPVEEEVAPVTNSFDSPLGPETAPATREEWRTSSDGDAIAVIPVEEGQLALVAEPEPQEPADTASSVPPAPPLDVMGQIKQAAELHSLGILTDEEFATAKSALLDALKGVAA